MSWRGFVVGACVGLLAASCGSDVPVAPEELADGENDSIITGGKADGGFGDCEVAQVLAYVNLPSTNTVALKKAGVHTRAAKAIDAYKLGADGLFGTEDDELFEDLKELDDVKYVGPKAMEQLVAIVQESCNSASPIAQVIFSPQPFEDSHLVKVAEAIDGAETNIDIAMYSFRDSGISGALERAVARGVQVRMVYESANKDKSKESGTKSHALEALGVDVRYVNKIMHHKFAIIDGPLFDLDAKRGTLITGSANWSNSAATRYDENTAFITGHDELMLSFQNEFNNMWDNSRDFEGGVVASDKAIVPIETIVDDPSAEALFTSPNFDVRTTSRGPTYTRVRGRSVVSDRIVELIAGAEESIHVASGHLRSRPIADALIQAHQENPDLDIRVYLDAQEYTSRFTQEKEQNKLADCLEEAGDDARDAENCFEAGFHFAIDLHDAGIEVLFKWYSYRWHYSYAKQMHHKYIIIDKRTVISGSYNFSPNAEFNTIENAIVFTGESFAQMAEAYEENFESLWSLGQEEGAYDALMDDIVNGDGEVPLVFDSMSIGWQQVNDFRRAVSAACPEVNSTEFRRHPERHFTCERTTP